MCSVKDSRLLFFLVTVLKVVYYDVWKRNKSGFLIVTTFCIPSHLSNYCFHSSFSTDYSDAWKVIRKCQRGLSPGQQPLAAAAAAAAKQGSVFSECKEVRR